MIFITGGRCQGKSAFILKMAGEGRAGFERCGALTESLKADLSGSFDTAALSASGAADGRTDEFCKAFSAPLVLHLESYVRRLMEDGQDPTLFLLRMIKENGRAVVVSDEIGSGIVPIDPFEREYREAAGRAGQKAAEASGQVYRVVCGIGIRLK